MSVSSLNRFWKCAAVVAIAGSTHGAVHAQVVIDQPVWTGSIQVLAFAPMGQSFTAVAPELVSIGARLVNFNVSQPQWIADRTMILNLYAGEGLNSGSLLASSVVDVAAQLGDSNGAAALVDFPFASVQLLPGATYTFELIANTARYGVSNARADVYPDGRSFYSTTGLPSDFPAPALNDLTFRVTAVPEARTSLLLLLGLTAILPAALRRRAST